MSSFRGRAFSVSRCARCPLARAEKSSSKQSTMLEQFQGDAVLTFEAHLHSRQMSLERASLALLTRASVAAETDECGCEESRLLAGCSQDWLPHTIWADLITC